MRNGQAGGTRGRVLYAIADREMRRVWFTCDRWLHNQPDDIILTTNDQGLLELLNNEQLRYVLGMALVGHDYQRVEVCNFQERVDGADRCRVIFYLDKDTTPVAILNLLLRELCRDEVTEPEDEEGLNAVMDQIRDLFTPYLFGPPSSKRPKRRPGPRRK